MRRQVKMGNAVSKSSGKTLALRWTDYSRMGSVKLASHTPEVKKAAEYAQLISVMIEKS